mmetsp:Transcript_7359/g.22664  ORF Transcript_7359/g.22664 Transcript_7359/m.22664 type:complete len:298 (+) Transcript_7359:1113-2006(+)
MIIRVLAALLQQKHHGQAADGAAQQKKATDDTIATTTERRCLLRFIVERGVGEVEGADDAGVVAPARGHDDLRRRRLVEVGDVAVQVSRNFRLNLREEGGALHDAAGEDDFLGRDGEHEVGGHGREVMRGDVPNFVIVRQCRQFRRVAQPGAPHERARRDVGLDLVPVGAVQRRQALRVQSVAGIARTRQVAGFGMEQPVHRRAVDDEAHADARAYRDVRDGREFLAGGAPLREGRRVDVGVERDRNASSTGTQRTDDVRVLPAGLRRLGDVAVSRRLGPRVDGPEARDAHGVELSL